jgi:hypothetical protein
MLKQVFRRLGMTLIMIDYELYEGQLTALLRLNFWCTNLGLLHELTGESSSAISAHACMLD